jgi:hypothetical protein
MSITAPVMLAMLLRVRRRVIVVGTGGAEKRAEAKKRKKLNLYETGFEAIQHCHVAFLETNDRMKQRMVTRFYSVTVNVWVARPACPPVCGSRM